MDNQPDTTMAEPSVSGSTFIPAPITAASNKAPALAPGTFTSILPGIEDLLSIIYAIAEGDETGNEAVVNKVRIDIGLMNLELEYKGAHANTLGKGGRGAAHKDEERSHVPARRAHGQRDYHDPHPDPRGAG